MQNIIVTIFIIFYSAALCAQNKYDVENLSHDKLIEIAKLGDVDAQYRLAKLISVGLISGNDLKYEYYIRSAAEKGHIEATYDWYQSVRWQWVVRNQDYPQIVQPIKVLLIKLAAQGEAHANYLLFKIHDNERTLRYLKNYDEKELKSKTADLIINKYLEKAAELGSHPAQNLYAHRLLSGKFTVKGVKIGSVEQDIPRAIAMLEASLGNEPDNRLTPEHYNDLICSSLITLYEVYSGERNLYLGDEGSKPKQDFIDNIKAEKALEKGRVSSCSSLMTALAEKLLEQDDRDLPDIYVLLADNLLVEKNSGPSIPESLDYLHLLLGQTAMLMKDLAAAKMHFSNIKTDSWKNIVLNRFGGDAALLCELSKVKHDKCEEFIFN